LDTDFGEDAVVEYRIAEDILKDYGY